MAIGGGGTLVHSLCALSVCVRELLLLRYFFCCARVRRWNFMHDKIFCCFQQRATPHKLVLPAAQTFQLFWICVRRRRRCCCWSRFRARKCGEQKANDAIYSYHGMDDVAVKRVCATRWLLPMNGDGEITLNALLSVIIAWLENMYISNTQTQRTYCELWLNKILLLGIHTSQSATATAGRLGARETRNERCKPVLYDLIIILFNVWIIAYHRI